jgi:hypothetical protein
MECILFYMMYSFRIIAYRFEKETKRKQKLVEYDMMILKTEIGLD